MKKLMMGALLAAMGLVAKAEQVDPAYFWWQINPEYVGDVGEYNAAYLYVLKDGNPELVGLSECSTAQISNPVATSDFSDDAYSFFWELAFWDESAGKATSVARSEETSFGYLKDEGYLIVPTSGPEIPQQKVFMPANFMAIPEPTSGVLLLLGMAGLALKRKRG